MEAGVRFCGNCGDVVEQPNAAEQKTATKAKISNKHIGMIACGAIVLVLVIVLISVFSGRGAESVLGRYVNAVGSFDMQAISRHSAFDMDAVIQQTMAAEGMTQREFNDLLFDMYGVRNLDALYRQMADEFRDELREEFGRNFRVTFDIVESFELSQREISQEIESVERTLSWGWTGLELSDLVRIDRINEMIEYTVDITISGSLGRDTERLTIIMVRIGRQWLVWDDSVLFGLPF